MKAMHGLKVVCGLSFLAVDVCSSKCSPSVGGGLNATLSANPLLACMCHTIMSCVQEEY